MSAIRFHFAEGPVLHVRGPERAMMGILTEHVALAAGNFHSGLGDDYDDLQLARFYEPFIDPRWHGYGVGLKRDLVYAMSGRMNSDMLSFKGKTIAPWSLALNTALAVGSDPVRLAAKIHATCEIHGFFEGQDREWLAGVIEEGLEEGVFRKELTYPKSDFREETTVSMGWTELIEQLRAPHEDADAVVMSFTVTDGFPDPPKSWRPNLEGDERWEAWWELPDRTRFDLALVEVRSREGAKPISPETLRKYRFRHELSLLDLMARDFDRIEKALKLRE